MNLKLDAGGDPPARDARAEHEETATDRWIGALLESQRLDSPAAIDRRVAHAMRAVRAQTQPASLRLRALESASRWSIGWWRAPVAAAATLAAVVGISLLFDPRPASASASALVRAAQVSESRAGDRSFAIRLLPPGPELSAEGGTGRPDAASRRPPTVHGRIDVRDAQHVRLEMELPDGKRVVRVLDGDTAWEQRPDGGIYRIPLARAMPRWIETDSGSVMVEQLENLLSEIADDYAVQRRPAAASDGMAPGSVVVTATRRSSDERGPATIDLWIDPATGVVGRAVLAWDRPDAGARGREDGPPPPRMEDGPRPREQAPPRLRDQAPPRPRDQAPPRPPAPGKLVIDRLPSAAFPADHFTAPSPPRDPGPPGGRGVRDGHPGPDRPRAPGGGDEGDRPEAPPEERPPF